MRLLFITFENMDTGASQLERLEYQLCYTDDSLEIHILCLNKSDNNAAVKAKYSGVVFHYHDIEYDGWQVVNSRQITEYVQLLDRQYDFDLIIQMMEVWDLLRELSKAFQQQRKFAGIIHAMPFLGTPEKIKDTFDEQLAEVLNSGNLPAFKYDYITQHSGEAVDVLSAMYIIAANQTVAYYFKHYFPMFDIRVLNVFYSRADVCADKDIDCAYDFLYMARIEKGKGLEYLFDIFKCLDEKASRQLKIGIAGRADSTECQDIIDRLCAYRFKNLKVRYIGWADEKMQQKLFSASAVFIYPSVYDSYSIVLKNAVSYGMSAVVWKVPFTLINYAGCSAIKSVEFGDYAHFAAEAMNCLDNKEILAQQALNFAAEHCSAEQALWQDIEIYADLIGLKNAVD